jgi:DHA1 family tetracycline resistance protein-like MFS transporter
MSAPAVSSGARNAGFIYIFITVLLDMLAIGIIIPVLPGLIVNFLQGNTARAAEIYGLFGTVWALMQFVFAPIQGSLSDRLGRRPVILVSNLGLGLDYILMALAPNLIWLFIGRLISGITTGNISAAYAYIADITEPEKRAKRFGMIGAAFGVGFIIGPAVGGILGGIDPRLPFWAAAAFCLTNAVYGFFILPESLPPEKRMPFSWKRASPLGSLKLLRSHPELFGLASANFLSNLAHVVLPSVTVLYMGYRYSWNETTIGLVLAAVGVLSMIVQGGLVGPIVAKLGERGALLIALLFGAAGFALYGFAHVGWVFLAGMPLTAIWGIANPAAQGLMSRRVSASEQGQLQGANASVQGIANLIGPVIFTQSFAYSIDPAHGLHLPGVPFLISSAALVLAAVIAWRATQVH